MKKSRALGAVAVSVALVVSFPLAASAAWEDGYNSCVRDERSTVRGAFKSGSGYSREIVNGTLWRSYTAGGTYYLSRGWLYANQTSYWQVTTSMYDGLYFGATDGWCESRFELS